MPSMDLFKTIENVYNPDVLKNTLYKFEDDKKKENTKKREDIEKLNTTIQEKTNKVKSSLKSAPPNEAKPTVDAEKLHKRAKTIRKASKVLQKVAAALSALAMFALIGGVGYVAGAGLLFALGTAATMQLIVGGWFVGAGVGLIITSTVTSKTAKILNSLKTIRQDRAIHSKNYQQFIDKFVNRDGFTLSEKDKTSRQLQAVYLDYKSAIKTMANSDETAVRV